MVIIMAIVRYRICKDVEHNERVRLTEAAKYSSQGFFFFPSSAASGTYALIIEEKLRAQARELSWEYFKIRFFGNLYSLI